MHPSNRDTRARGMCRCVIALLVSVSISCSRQDVPSLSGRVTAGVPIPEESLSKVLEKHHVPGVSIAVVHRGQVDWTKGYGVCEYGKDGRVDTTTLFQAASISKPVSAVVALRLVERNELGLDENVNHKLTSWRDPDNEFTKNNPITLRNLLSHSAGLTMHGVPEFALDEEVPTLIQILDGRWPSAKDSVRLVSKPGSEFRYSGGGYIVLQVLLTDVAKRPFAELARELVLKPAGMLSSTFEQPLPRSQWLHASVGHTGDGTPLRGKWHTLPEQAAGGLWTTPKDLALFMIALWRSYHGQPDALLPQHLASEMLTRQVDDFGLGIALPAVGVFRFQHSGGNAGYRCFMVLSVDVPDGAVIMTNGDSGEQVINEVFQAIAHAYGWLV